jgi:hypothetical protein
MIALMVLTSHDTMGVSGKKTVTLIARLSTPMA